MRPQRFETEEATGTIEDSETEDAETEDTYPIEEAYELSPITFRDNIDRTVSNDSTVSNYDIGVFELNSWDDVVKHRRAHSVSL